MAQDFEKARQAAAIPSADLIENEDGTLRAATEKEVLLATFGAEWAAAGQIILKHVLEDISRQYDEAVAAEQLEGSREKEAPEE